jgi:hypothetical protein
MQIRYFLLINLIFFSTTTIKAQGTLDAWGYDAVGQVSDMPMLNDFISVSSGENHNIGLLSDGSIVSWGYDNAGQVSTTPTGTSFIEVTAGGNHSVALRSDGSLVSWGYDSNGVVSNTPTDSDFIAVSAGQFHSVALRSDGSLVSWGSNQYGQINTPVGTNFTQVSAGNNHTIALCDDGSIVSWGADQYLQVGDAPSRTGFSAVEAGGNHSLAIKTPSLAYPPVLSSTNGGLINLDFRFPSIQSGAPYLVLGSITGTSTGFSYGNFHIALDYDRLTAMTLRRLYRPQMLSFNGIIDPNGDAFALLAIMPGEGQGFVGKTFYWTAVSYDILLGSPISISNTISFDLFQ